MYWYLLYDLYVAESMSAYHTNVTNFSPQ